MNRQFDFFDKVAIVTGAGGGLGRAYALLLAGRGAKVVVNDLGGSASGEGASTRAADRVVEEIRAAGGDAVANYDSVEDGARIVQTALDHFGTVDIVINNAGILRDVSFHKMTDADWDIIQRVHLRGSYAVTHAAWPILRDKGYGRVIFTTSAAGLYGNFGQANYSAAKLGLLGLARTLAIEGAKRNINVNTIAPIAGSRLTETILPEDLVKALKPEYVAPLVAYLCHESCAENGGLFEVGAGWISRLRWERTRGAFFPIPAGFSIEDVAAQWPAVNDWREAEHPTTAQDSFTPVAANLSAPPAAKIGNEFVDPARVLGYEFEPVTTRYDERETSLYALGIGSDDLRFVYEGHSHFAVFPTYPVIFGFSLLWRVVEVPGLKFNPMLLLHGEQYLELKRPLPTQATVTHRARISQLYDKGDKGAVIILDVNSEDEQGAPVAFNQYTLFIRGIGNFGGERGPSGAVNEPPDRSPDAVVEERVPENQAMLYRLSGNDRNPLHIDPGMAAIGGFDRPILHGLCTFGYAVRAVLHSFAADDPARFQSVRLRFARHVFPGETLVTEMWREGDRVIFQTRVKERDVLALSHAAVMLTGIPAEAARPAEAAAPALKSAVFFAAAQRNLAANPDISRQVGAIYQFNISAGATTTAWIVDLKNNPPGVAEGVSEAAECIISATDDDFWAMTQGQLEPQTAFMQGKLRVKGNIMLATKLQSLFNA